MIINVAPQATIATTPDPPSVANGGFAPLCGAAATPVAALKAPVASPEEGTTLDVRCWHLLFGQTRGSAPTVDVVTPSKNAPPLLGARLLRVSGRILALP